MQTLKEMCCFLSYLQRDKKFVSISQQLREVETFLKGFLRAGSIKTLIDDVLSKAELYETIMEAIEKKTETASQYSPFHLIKK